MIVEPGTGPAKRLAHGFELSLGRQPSAKELTTLQKALDARLARFRADAIAAKKLLAVGQSAVSQDVDPAELAAYATVARIILNLSEFITKG